MKKTYENMCMCVGSHFFHWRVLILSQLFLGEKQHIFTWRMFWVTIFCHEANKTNYMFTILISQTSKLKKATCLCTYWLFF